MSDFDNYLLLVRRLGAGGINRSENDLSSNLKNALSTFGLHGVIDTGSGRNRTKRPDIALYVEREAADVGAAADVIIEAKKPAELSQFTTLLEALTHDELWQDKFVPYVAAHAERIAFFVLTTFDRFLVVSISTALRSSIQVPSSFPDRASRLLALSPAIAFDITDAEGARAFTAWCAGNLSPGDLVPPQLSTISDLRAVNTARALGNFASDLADVVVGPVGRSASGGALIHTITAGGTRLNELAPDIQRALVVYTMSAHGGMAVDVAEGYLRTHWQDEWGEFVSASVHSLIGRLFSIKAIEDGFCIDTEPPLIPRNDWVFIPTGSTTSNRTD